MTDQGGLVADAFALGDPVGGLRQIQVGSYETWRLDTVHGSFLVKRLWSGADPSWRSQYETSMELERRAVRAGVPTATPVPPVEPTFGWAARVDGHGMWRAYEWLENTTAEAAEIDEQWFGETLALLHTLFPLGTEAEPEWRWLGVHSVADWRRWLGAAARAWKSWAATAQRGLGDILGVTDHLRKIYETATDHVVSHLDFGPWNMLRTSRGLVLIDWENAGPTTATAELGRGLEAFGLDDPDRMRRLIRAYRTAGGIIAGRPEDLFNWQLGQHLSGITERIKITLGELDDDENPEPAWLDPATIDADISRAIDGLPGRREQLSILGARVMSTNDHG